MQVYIIIREYRDDGTHITVEFMETKRGLGTGDWITIIAAVLGIAAVVFTLDWIIRSVLVISAIGLIIFAAVRHSAHPFIRGPLAAIVTTLFIAFSWHPIWEDFHKSYPATSAMTAFLYAVLAGVIVAAMMLTYRLASRPITEDRRQLDPFLAVALFGAVLVVAGIGGYSLSAGPTAPRVEMSAASSLSEPSKIVSVPTAAEDVPKKLKAIDNFEEILRDELEPIVRRGMQLSTGKWWNDAVSGKVLELREDAVNWRNAPAELAHRLRTMRDQSEKFPDIQALYDPSYENVFNPAMERFVGAIGNLGDEKWNPETLKFFMQPIANDCYKELNNVESWRRMRLQAAIELRKKFSQ
jgi:hypothetical protein